MRVSVSTPVFRKGFSRAQMWELLQTKRPCEVAHEMGVHTSQVHTALAIWRKAGHTVPSFKPPPRVQPVVHRLKVSRQHNTQLSMIARGMGLSTTALLSQLVTVIVDDNLVNSILD